MPVTADTGDATEQPVYTMQPVVQPVEQPASSCKQTFNRLLFKWSDNRLYRVNPWGMVEVGAG